MSAGEGELDGADTNGDVPPGDAVNGGGDPDSGDMQTDRLRDDAESDPMNPQTESVNVEPDVTREDVSPLGITNLERRRLERARREAAREEAQQRAEAAREEAIAEQKEEYAAQSDRFGTSDIIVEDGKIRPSEAAVEREQAESIQQQKEEYASGLERFDASDIIVEDGQLVPSDAAVEREQAGTPTTSADWLTETERQQRVEQAESQLRSQFDREINRIAPNVSAAGDVDATVVFESGETQYVEDVVEGGAGPEGAQLVYQTDQGPIETQSQFRTYLENQGIDADAIETTTTDGRPAAIIEGSEFEGTGGPEFVREDIPASGQFGVQSISEERLAEREQAQAETREQAAEDLAGQLQEQYSDLFPGREINPGDEFTVTAAQQDGQTVYRPELSESFRAEAEQRRRADLRERVAEEAGAGFDTEDVTVTDTDDGSTAQLSLAARLRERREAAAAQAAGQADPSLVVGAFGAVRDDLSEEFVVEFQNRINERIPSGDPIDVSDVPEVLEEEIARRALGSQALGADREAIYEAQGDVESELTDEQVMEYRVELSEAYTENRPIDIDALPRPVQERLSETIAGGVSEGVTRTLLPIDAAEGTPYDPEDVTVTETEGGGFSASVPDAVQKEVIAEEVAADAGEDVEPADVEVSQTEQGGWEARYGPTEAEVKADLADEFGPSVTAEDVELTTVAGEDEEIGTEDDQLQGSVDTESVFSRLREERAATLGLEPTEAALEGRVGEGGRFMVFPTVDAAQERVEQIVGEHAQYDLQKNVGGQWTPEYQDETFSDWAEERTDDFNELITGADPHTGAADVRGIVEEIDQDVNLTEEGREELAQAIRDLSFEGQFESREAATEFQLGDGPQQTRVIEDEQGVDQAISMEESREIRLETMEGLEEEYGTDITFGDFTIGESAVDVDFQAETQAQIINDPQTPAAREYSREVRRQVASDLDAQTAADVTAGDIGEATVDEGEVQIGVADGTPSTLQQDAVASRRRALEGIGFEGVGTENFRAPEAPGQTTLAEQQQRQALEGIGFEGVGTENIRAPDAPGQATLIEQQRQQALEGIGAGVEYRREQTLESIDEQVETSVGRQRARELGITPSLVGGDLSRLADLQRGEDYTVQQTGSETTAELTEEFQREFAAGRIERELEEQTGADITRGDIELTQTEDGGFRGRLTKDAQQRIGVEQEPLVQLTEGTPFEGVFQTGATIGAEQASQRAERRETLFDRIGARDEAEAALRSIGLGGAIEGFENLQTETRSAFDEFRQGLFQTGGDVAGEAGARLETGAALLAAPLVGGVEQAGVEPEDANIPSPSESPEEFAAAAAPFAATEPSPLGELAVAGALVGAGALAARERVSQPSLDPARAEATAQGVGLFAPEQEIPEGGDMFVSEQEVEPPSYDIPELLPPTDASVGEGTPSPTPPEIEQPQEAIGRGFFPAEQAQPSQPIGRGFFQSEVDVPTARAASALQQGEGTVERSRVRRRRDRSSLPDSFIPDEPATIGGETIERGGQVSESPGPRFVFRPNPRSMELYRIETDEGGFRVGPEYTRFLESQPLDSDLGPEVEPISAADTLPPAQRLGGEFSAAGGVRADRQRSFLEEEAARASVDPFGDRGLPLPDELGGERADTGPFDIADRRADAGVDEFQRDQAVPDILDRAGEDLGQPQDTATSPFAASDTVQDQRQQERQEFGQPSDTVRTTTVDPFEFESPFADLTAEATGEFAYEYAFEFPTGRRRPRLDLDDRDEDDPAPEDLADPYAFRQERELLNPFLGR